MATMGQFFMIGRSFLVCLEIVWLVATVVYISANFYIGKREPKLERVEIKIKNLGDRPFKIVLLTDLHIGNILGKEFLSQCVERVNELNPDLVAIAGDLVDAPADKIFDDLSPLKNLRSRYGNFFVLGNHEYYSGVDETLSVLKQLGVNTLVNETAMIATPHVKFNLAGIADVAGEQLNAYMPNFKLMVQKRREDYPTVLLAHTPKAVGLVDEYIDLVLSGHTHGGQFFPFGYLAGLANKYLKGLYHFNVNKTKHKSILYVSRGTGYWGMPFRSPEEGEITEITLVPAN